ncbi:MAG: hypothetical protein IK116_06045 [Firmicutes bacterium]|nr:hypothetical protein [Bacillota bacterium]
MKEIKPRSDRAFQLDQWMALHQRRCWLIAAGAALAGAAAIVYLAPASSRTVLIAALAMGLMLLYRWSAGAPGRAMTEWVRRLREESTPDRNREYLDFLLRMEKSLPTLQRKELAFPLLIHKSYRLNLLGRGEEALTLLRSYHQIWDPAMKERIEEMIRLVSGETPPEETQQKEQP